MCTLAFDMRRSSFSVSELLWTPGCDDVTSRRWSPSSPKAVSWSYVNTSCGFMEEGVRRDTPSSWTASHTLLPLHICGGGHSEIYDH